MTLRVTWIAWMPPLSGRLLESRKKLRKHRLRTRATIKPIFEFLCVPLQVFLGDGCMCARDGPLEMRERAFDGVATYTAVAIGPDTHENLQPITGHLKLL